jgi:integrase
MFFQGFRRSLVARLVPRWIDWEAKSITIPAGAAKNRRELPVAMHPRAARAIKAQMKANGSIDPGAPIFGSLDYSNPFWTAVDKLGLDRHGLVPHHVGRHTSATLMAKAGASTIELQAALGWSSREMPDRYTHPTVDLGRRAFARMK